jgi:uncharacterized protein (TIGR00290 family)
MSHKSYFNWSGGKDSALALYHAMQDDDYTIDKLLTSINHDHERVSMHGVRVNLADRQASSLGIPMQKLLLPGQASMEIYEQTMRDAIHPLREEGYTHAIFGDIFLEDLRKYREVQLAREGFEAVFPIWKRDTRTLVKEFIDLGFRAIVVCVNAACLDKSFAGRIIDEEFLDDLPSQVDPCGENGEFHSFVFAGPIFKYPIPYRIGEIVYREYKAPVKTGDDKDSAGSESGSMGFWFCDLQEVD